MLAFAHIQKTAGTTITKILRRSYGTKHCDVKPWRSGQEYYSADDHRTVQRIYPDLVSIAGHEVKPYSDLQSVCPHVLYLVYLREPLARAASNFQHTVRVGRGKPFEEWIENERWHNRQTRHIAGIEDVDAAIRVLEGENVLIGLTSAFDEALVMLKLRYGDPRLDIRYRRENVAPENAIKQRALREPPVRALLEETNRIDLELYEYVLNELYPRQRRDFPELEGRVAEFQRANRVPAFSLNEALNVVKRNLTYKPALRIYRRLNPASVEI